MHLKSTINNLTTSSKDVPVFLLTTGERRVFVKKTDTYQELVHIINKKFQLATAPILTVSSLDICRGEDVEVDEDVYDHLAACLDEIKVTLGTKKNLAIASAGRVSKGKAWKVEPATEKVVALAAVSASKFSSEDDEEERDVAYPARASKGKARKVEPVAEKVEVGPAVVSASKDSSEDDEEERDGTYPPTSEDEESYEEDEEDEAEVEQEVATPSSSKSGKSWQHVEREDKIPVTARKEFVKAPRSPAKPPRSPAREPSVKLDKTVKKEPSSPATKPVKKEQIAPADPADLFASDLEVNERMPPPPPKRVSAPSTQSSQSEQPDRFKVRISSPGGMRHAEFLVRGKHSVGKVLSGACRNYGLDASRAHLALITSWENDDGEIIDEPSRCDSKETLAKCGIEPRSRLEIVMED